MLATLILAGVLTAPAVDSPWYFDKAARDSAANYRGQVEAYRQEFVSYEWGHTFAMLPVAGEWYVDKTATGIRYSVARLGMVAISTVGAVRLIGNKPYLGLNVGLLAGGIVGWFALKASEISDVMHTISEKDEALVEKYQIKEQDIIPGSIRYPTKQWPAWITAGPEARKPERAREVVDRALPAP